MIFSEPRHVSHFTGRRTPHPNNVINTSGVLVKPVLTNGYLSRGPVIRTKLLDSIGESQSSGVSISKRPRARRNSEFSPNGDFTNWRDSDSDPGLGLSLNVDRREADKACQNA